MNLQERAAKRFVELEQEMNKLPKHAQGSSSFIYDTAPVQQWATSVMNLVYGIFSENSPHCKNFDQAYAKCSQASTYWSSDVEPLQGIFKAAKADFDGGHFYSVQILVSGEIFGDFVSLAKASLLDNYKDVAAVLACAALEDTLKRYAALNGIEVNDKVMQEVVAAIKAKGLVTGAQKTLLDSMPKIRDFAMHANWDKITSQDVASVLGFVEQFLVVHFS